MCFQCLQEETVVGCPCFSLPCWLYVILPLRNTNQLKLYTDTDTVEDNREIRVAPNNGGKKTTIGFGKLCNKFEDKLARNTKSASSSFSSLRGDETKLGVKRS